MKEDGMYIHENKTDKLSKMAKNHVSPIQMIKTYVLHDFIVEGQDSEVRPKTPPPFSPDDQDNIFKSAYEHTHIFGDAIKINQHKHNKAIEHHKSSGQPREVGHLPFFQEPMPQPNRRDEIEEDEDLILIGHGEPTQDDFVFGTYTAEQLTDYIQRHQLLPNGYMGSIYLDGCRTGEKIAGNEKTPYTKFFGKELLKKMPNLGNFSVKGNIGEALTKNNGEYVKINHDNFEQFYKNCIKYVDGTGKPEKKGAFEQFVRNTRPGSIHKLFDHELGGAVSEIKTVVRDIEAEAGIEKCLFVRGKTVKYRLTRQELERKVNSSEN